jgi:hypothetical protein
MAYKVYTAEVRLFGTPGLLITTAYEDGSKLCAESFAIVGNDVACRQLSFDRKDIPKEVPDEFQPNQAFMLEMALQQANVDLEDLLDRAYAGRLHARPINPQITEGDRRIFVHARVRGYGPALDKVFSTTNCEELKAIMEPILKMPRIIIK